MAKTAVYYFSGTGNSLYLAREIAKLLDGDLISITSAIGLETICPDADVVGIVYPVYYNDLPVIVKDFAVKLSGIRDRYIFAVCNYGGCGSQSVKTLQELIKTNGGELASAYGIHMPQNAFLKGWENNDRLIEKAGAKTKLIAENIKAKKKGIFMKSFLDIIFIRIHKYLVPKVKVSLSKISGLSPETDLDVLVRMSDKSYSTNGNCTGCGVCACVCPVGNIEIRDSKPHWLNHCEACLACYDWCPNKAIEGSAASKGYHYINPKIKVSEIIAQRIAAGQ